GFSINLELLDRASLLHDIGKFETLGTDLDHHIRGKEIISELGFPEVAHLASMHGQYPLENYGSWEEKILAYADGRTMHDKTVTTRERIEEWMQRCPQDVPKYPNVIKDALALAAHIEAVVDVKEIK
ncbi:HD domain-containing protein, partial [Candidatus Woesearchaeota archaeon]|nr:HD domain-containing protein [Candidatus Woesearchaeota archaeon]